jgi:ligand-binding SRPBCC domain-containing protein
MAMPTVTAAVHLPVPAERAFALHADVRNLPRLSPPGVRVLCAHTPTHQGDVQVLALGPRAAAVRWVAWVERFEPPRLMVDVQRSGPFRRFRHTHLIVPDGEECVLVDVVEFRFFPGRLGAVLDGLLVSPVLRLLFAARHRRTVALLRRAPVAGARDEPGRIPHMPAGECGAAAAQETLGVRG